MTTLDSCLEAGAWRARRHRTSKGVFRGGVTEFRALRFFGFMGFKGLV